jgi:anti-sigma factor RsiW
MSSHEHERLSAYLDGELPPGERAQVAAHLDACAECAARLAELQAVDEAAASLPSDAPHGYFEAFPARVRARLEPRTRRRQLPAWTWAAAAALLLAVVTPLTLLRRPVGPPAAPAREIAAPTSSLAEPRPPSESLAPLVARAEPKQEAPRTRPVPAATPLPEKKREAFASAPGAADAGATSTRVSPEQPPVAPSAPAFVPASAAREQEAVAAADEAAPAEALGAEARSQAAPLAERRAVRSRETGPQVATAEPGVAQGRVANSAAGALAPKLVATEVDWLRLAAARPRTPAEWRRLREEWREFVARDPGGARADEARVRTIEAGREAWRGGGDALDEAAFRADAAAYLERDDAAQKERVRRLVAEAARP